MISPDHQAVAIVKRLRQEGYESYLAGGCVRDFLLNKTPQDYDIATSARSEDVQRIFPRTIPVGAQFGVVLVMLDGQSFEVASFRFDGPYLDGRRPSQVRYGTLQEDIFRRDFTINGMVYDPVEDRLIDLVEGKRDLARRCNRAIGDRAFSADPAVVAEFTRAYVRGIKEDGITEVLMARLGAKQSIMSRLEDLAALEALNCGKPIGAAKGDEMPAIVDCYRFFAGAVRSG